MIQLDLVVFGASERETDSAGFVCFSCESRGMIELHLVVLVPKYRRMIELHLVVLVPKYRRMIKLDLVVFGARVWGND